MFFFETRCIYKILGLIIICWAWHPDSDISPAPLMIFTTNENCEIWRWFSTPVRLRRFDFETKQQIWNIKMHLERRLSPPQQLWCRSLPCSSEKQPVQKGPENCAVKLIELPITKPVASIRVVSPGAVTDGVTFFTSKAMTYFSHRHHFYPLCLSMWSFVQCSCKCSRKKYLDFH